MNPLQVAVAKVDKFTRMNATTRAMRNLDRRSEIEHGSAAAPPAPSSAVPGAYIAHARPQLVTRTCTHAF